MYVAHTESPERTNDDRTFHKSSNSIKRNQNDPHNSVTPVAARAHLARCPGRAAGVTGPGARRSGPVRAGSAPDRVWCDPASVAAGTGGPEP